MNSFFRNFLTNRNLFFDLFDNAAQNVVKMATLLVAVVNNQTLNEPADVAKQIDKLENRGDDITHKIYLGLNKIIFPPLRRNDILALASTIDDVADTIKEAGNRIYLYNVVEFAPAIKEIAAILLQASMEIETAVALLRTSKYNNQLREICRQVKTYERQADKIYYQAVATLFAHEKDAIKLIKHREILLSMETSVNKCKSVTDALNAVLVNSL